MSKTPAEPSFVLSDAEFQKITQSYAALRLAEKRLLAEGEIFKQRSQDLAESRARYRKCFEALLAAREMWRAHANLKIPGTEKIL